MIRHGAASKSHSKASYRSPSLCSWWDKQRLSDTWWEREGVVVYKPPSSTVINWRDVGQWSKKTWIQLLCLECYPSHWEIWLKATHINIQTGSWSKISVKILTLLLLVNVLFLKFRARVLASVNMIWDHCSQERSYHVLDLHVFP